MAKMKIEVGLDEFLVQLRSLLQNAPKASAGLGSNVVIVQEEMANMIIAHCDKFLSNVEEQGTIFNKESEQYVREQLRKVASGA